MDQSNEKNQSVTSIWTCYPWKIRNFPSLVDKPLDLCSVTPWNGWTEIEYCKVCRKGPFSKTYEITLEWGDTKEYEYISEVCSKCLHELNVNYVRNKSDKY